MSKKKSIYKEVASVLEVVTQTKCRYSTYLVLLGIQTLCGNEFEIACYKEAFESLQSDDAKQLHEAQSMLLKNLTYRNN